MKKPPIRSRRQGGSRVLQTQPPNANSTSLRRASPERSENLPKTGISGTRISSRNGRMRFKSAREILSLESRVEVQWIAQPWLAQSAITELVGKAKVAGKTT